jgi:DNA excision repair protein ERCC-2
LRGKDDYGIMVLADRRFQKKRNQLPKWISQAMLESETNLSTDMAVATAKNFLRTMAQPFRAKDQEGISTWSLADIERHREKQMLEEERVRREAAANGQATNGAHNGAAAAADEFDDDIDEDLMMLDAQ